MSAPSPSTGARVDLGSRVALVTGGARGIGAAVARRLAQRGAHVVVADVDPAGEQVATDVGGRFVGTDVSRSQDNQEAVDTAVHHYGRLDVVVLNAGVGEPGDFLTGFRTEDYRRLVAVNLDGVVYGLHAALTRLVAQGTGGSVVVTASLSGLAESPHAPLYGATKHAVVGLVRSVAPLVAEHGITVNAVCPTFVDTPMVAEAVPFLRDAGVAVLDPDDVADVVEAVLADGGTGHAWPAVPHGDPSPFPFPPLPSLMTDPHPTEAPS